jgi:hypothetical protein
MEPVHHAVSQGVFSLFELSAKLNPYILLPVCLAVSALFIGYLRNYQWPAQTIRDQLARVTGQIKTLKAEPGLSLAALENRLYYIFEQSPFGHLWTEYRHTLHTVSTQGSATEVQAVLATVPAETFFSKESIVDIRINADFYRHLPGILTGIGIIGTFSGLVWGLYQFKPDPDQTLESLPLLLQEVTSAFIGSGIAILAAIFITYKEKSILNRCYRLVEELNKEIDGMYATGAGEAYLARLVTAAESGPAAARGLKDALLEDLSRLMHAVSERQIDAQRKQNQAMSSQISEAIRLALAEPLAKLSGIVQEVTKDQREAVGGLIENVQAGFMDKLGDTFGQQIKGIGLSIQQSSDTIGKVQDAMTRSISDISNAGMSAADRMSGRLEDTLLSLVSAQEQMSLQMVEQQKQSSAMMDVTVRSILAQLQSVLGGFSLERSRQMEQDQQRHENLLSSTQALYGGLSESVGRLVEDIKLSAFKTGESLASLQHTVIHAVSGMTEGAVIMRDAADRFTTAGDSISGMTETMSRTASSLHLTAALVRQAFEEYDKMRETAQQYVAQLQMLLGMLTKESGVSQKLVDDMERIVGSFAVAERQSMEYLDRINEILKQSFHDFGLEMVGQVRNISAESNRQLGTSLHALSGTVDSVIASVTKLRRAG